MKMTIAMTEKQKREIMRKWVIASTKIIEKLEIRIEELEKENKELKAENKELKKKLYKFRTDIIYEEWLYE